MNLKKLFTNGGLMAGLITAGVSASHAQTKTVFETTSVYHHIQVIDEGDLRIMSFDGSRETQMKKSNPLEGHFQYTEFFQMPFIWNDGITNALMIGMGGGSTQRAYEHYYTNTFVDTVEIDQKVFDVAKEYFDLKETPKHKVNIVDGRVFLNRSQKKYDTIIMDAYVKNRYGSFIPFHLVTKEFFEIAKEHMTENGVLAYNVIGQMDGWQADIVGAVYKTLDSVFPNVYMFPATDSLNVVMIATMSEIDYTPSLVAQRVNYLTRTKKVTFPGFARSAAAFRPAPPRSLAQSPILTDEHAPVEGILRKAE